MKKLITVISLVVTTQMLFAQVTVTQADKDRAADIVAKMSLEQKCLLIAGQTDGFHTYGVEQLGIPAVRMADGPQGVRNNTRSTYYPSGIAVAATWNRDAAKGVGTGIGYDAYIRGVRIMLCPGVNIYRSPLCGRNFEYYGEDPYLAGEAASNYIQGIQSQGVISTIKHFALNNQEYDRHNGSSNADLRTINEIYFPVFKKAVQEAGVGAVMTSYNLINSVHAAESEWLIKDNLRAWGFDGIVMSDWSSTYTTLGCVEGGLDLEMPRGTVLNHEAIKPLIDRGIITESQIDEKCIHILQTFSAFGILDNPAVEDARGDLSYGVPMAYKAALESPVLLKNDGVLPIRKGRIAVLGPNADFIAFGGGSGKMHPIEGTTTTLYEGLSKLGRKYKVSLFKDAEDTEALAAADVVVVAAGFEEHTESEGFDRTYTLPEGQDELIEKAAAAGRKVVVVINSGGEVDITRWADKVSAIVMAWYGGQETGNALAALLSGEVSPSGRLPFTFWGSYEKNPTSPYYHLVPGVGVNRNNPYKHTDYNEGIFVGYRAEGRITDEKPMFPFGYGLTYSSFEYSDISVVPTVDGFDVSFTLANTGRYDASEVSQLYISAVDHKDLRPLKELKGFEKTAIRKGGKQRVTIHVESDAFSTYDLTDKCWKPGRGEFRILVGASVDDIRLETKVELL